MVSGKINLSCCLKLVCLVVPNCIPLNVWLWQFTGLQCWPPSAEPASSCLLNHDGVYAWRVSLLCSSFQGSTQVGLYVIYHSTEIYLATSRLKFLANSNLQSQLGPLAKFIDVALRPMKAKQRLVSQVRQQPAAMQLMWFRIGRSESVQGWSREDYTETWEGRSFNSIVVDLKLRLIWAMH